MSTPAHLEFELGYCGSFLHLDMGRKERHPLGAIAGIDLILWIALAILACIIGLIGILGRAWRFIATPKSNQPYDDDDI